ncbi:MAG: hypothetical protein QXV17_04980 [Candidatus Micrarchaeaceae archaeon]
MLYGDAYVEVLYSNRVDKIDNTNKTVSHQDLGLIIHDPKNIVIVKDENDNIYGYVEISDLENTD